MGNFSNDPKFIGQMQSLDETSKKLSEVRIQDYHGAGIKIGSMYKSVKWEMKFRDGQFVNQIEHQAESLETVLKMFERFCKGCGYEFAGFAVVDEDGIPVNGLNPMARLETGKENEDTSS